MCKKFKTYSNKYNTSKCSGQEHNWCVSGNLTLPRQWQQPYRLFYFQNYYLLFWYFQSIRTIINSPIILLEAVFVVDAVPDAVRRLALVPCVPFRVQQQVHVAAVTRHVIQKGNNFSFIVWSFFLHYYAVKIYNLNLCS